ncbi:S24 family peptidase [Acidithiobacillus sulfuriphilus]|uniref:S24 family peptidase n=1 Tax=Acidithiobacillus sulfuriphilus TaxID=1867749 RepID=UPI003F6012AD
MFADPCPTIYLRVKQSSIPAGHLPASKNDHIIRSMDEQGIRRRNLAKVRDADFGGNQQAMADKAGCPASLLSRILHGKRVEDRIRVWERNLGYQVGSLDRADFEPVDALRLGFSEAAHAANPQFLPGAALISVYHPEDTLEGGEIEVPALNVRVGAGNRIQTEPVQEDRTFRYSREWIQRYGLNPDKLIRYRVQGTSMEPAIQDGSWITVEMGEHPVKDGCPYLIRSGDQVMVKYVWRRPDGGVIIRSHNPIEPDIVVPVAEMEHVTILGEVIESVTMWRKSVRSG